MTSSVGLLPRLGVNIDHIATLRQLRGTAYPDILEAARLAVRGGADQITIHLREDRRHIQDEDVRLLRRKLTVPMNLECSLSEPMIRLALKTRPDWVCLVPERRQEVTTEGGLDLKKNRTRLHRAVERFHGAKIRVSLFVEPSLQAMRASADSGAQAVELHTGRYCLQKSQLGLKKERARLKSAGLLARDLGLHVHAGHGLDTVLVRPLCEWDLIEEFNIGHSIVCRAALVGMERAVREMRSALLAP